MWRAFLEYHISGLFTQSMSISPLLSMGFVVIWNVQNPDISLALPLTFYSVRYRTCPFLTLSTSRTHWVQHYLIHRSLHAWSYQEKTQISAIGKSFILELSKNKSHHTAATLNSLTVATTKGSIRTDYTDANSGNVSARTTVVWAECLLG